MIETLIVTDKESADATRTWMNLIPVFNLSNLPKPETTNFQISIYKGVLIQWEDEFSLLPIFVKEMRPNDRENLLAVYEHEKKVSFIWSEYIPMDYEAGKVLPVCGRVWEIVKSELHPGVRKDFMAHIKSRMSKALEPFRDLEQASLSLEDQTPVRVVTDTENGYALEITLKDLRALWGLRDSF